MADFDPDAYLQKYAPEPNVFDPDAYLAKYSKSADSTPQPAPESTSASASQPQAEISAPITEQIKAAPKTVKDTLAQTGIETVAGEEGLRAQILKSGAMANEEEKAKADPNEPLQFLQGVGPTDAVRARVESAGKVASQSAEENAKDFAAQAADRETTSAPGKITSVVRGITKGAGMAAEAAIPGVGLPVMATAGATQAYGAAKAAGKSEGEAENAGVRTLMALAAFGGANKAVSAGITKYLGNAPALKTFLVHALGQAAGNEVTSRVIAAYEAAMDAPEGKRLQAAANAAKQFNLESTAQNIGFAFMGAAGEAGKAKPGESPTKGFAEQARAIPDAQFDAAIQQYKKLPNNDPRKVLFETEIARRAYPNYQPTASTSPAPTATPAAPPPSETPPTPDVAPVSQPEIGGRSALFQQAKKDAGAKALTEVADTVPDGIADATKAATLEAAKKLAEPLPPVAEVETPEPVKQPEPIAEKKAPADEVPPVKESAPVEPVKEPGTRIVGPAIADKDGNLIAKGEIGQNHAELKSNEIKNGNVDAVDASHVFVDDKGNVLDREQAWELAKKAGQIPKETLGAQERGVVPSELHSEHLTAQEDQVKKGQELPPEPKKRRSQKILEELGDDELAAPAPEPAPSTSAPGAGSEPAAKKERTPEEKISALQEELKTAPNRDKTRIKKAIAELKGETKSVKPVAEEPETKNPTLDELLAKESERLAKEQTEGKKELWQMNRKEAAASGKRGNAYMEAVKAAVKEGKPVPREVLDQFKLFGWAREAAGLAPFTKKGISPKGDIGALLEALKTVEKEPKMKRGSPESGASTLIPDIAEKVANAGRYAYEKGMQFAEWATTMAKAFGEKVRPYLESAWKAIAGDSESGAIGAPGGGERKMGAERAKFIAEVGKPALREAAKAMAEAEDAGWSDEDATNYAINKLRDLVPDVDEEAARQFFSGAEQTETKGGDSNEKGNEEKGRQEGVLKPGEGETVQAPSPEPDTTALKRSVVDEQRAARGGEEIPTPVRKSDEQIVGEAKSRIEADPTIAPQIVSRIVDEKDSRISREDAATILAERRRVINERNKWESIAGAKDSTEAAKSQARIALGGIEQHLDRLDQASRAAGSAWSDVGRMYQVDLREDFTEEAMKRKLRAAKGRPLNEAERQAVEARSKRIAQLEKEAAEETETRLKLAEAKEVIRTHEATIADLKKGKESKPAKGTNPLSESIVTYARSVRDAAMARIKERKGKMFADPLGVMSAIDLADHAIVGATHIIEGAVTFGKWSTAMVKDFGESIKPHLKLIYDSAKEQAKKIEKEAGQSKEKTPVQAKARVKAQATAGEELSNRAVYDLARAHINAGVHGEDAVMKAVHNDIKESYPDATERDVRRAFSEYGKVKFPSKDAVDTELREIRRLTSLQESIDRETAGLDALHSGLQRDKATQAIREKQKQLNELLKNREGPPSPEKLASREEAKQTALRNAIADLDKQLRTGEETPRRAPTTDSPATEQLRAERDAMREKLNEIEAEANPPKTPAEKQIGRLGKVRDRLDDTLSGKLDPKKPADRALLSKEAENIQSEIDSMRELAAQMKRDALPAKDPGSHSEQMQIRALEKSIEKYSKKTAERDFTSSGTKLGPDSARVAALKEIRDSRREMYEAVRDLGKVVKSADEIYNERRMKDVQKQLAAVKERIANKDFAPKPKPAEKNKTLDVRKKEEELAKEKGKFQMGVMEAERANRTAFQKFTGGFANLNRINVLGHISVLEHLAGAAVENLATRPVGTALAQLMRVNKTLDAIRRKAVYEGNVGGEKAGLMATAKAWSSMVQKLKTGKSQLDWLHDAKQYPKEFGEIVGNVHAFIKEPIRQGIYARSMELRTKAAEDMGLDPAHDEVLAKSLSMEAYNDANRDIFMGDNFLTKAIHNNVGAYLRGVKEDPGLARFTADVLDILFPVVNVSTNIAIRKARLAIGLAEGGIRIGAAAKKGELANNAEGLSQADAEKITRALKYGAFGLAIGAYAWTHANQFGGVYAQGENAPRDKKTGLQTGEIALPGGGHLSHHITHGPVGGFMNLVADGKRLYDSKVKGNGASPWSAGGEAAAFTAMAGLTDLPAFATVGRLTSPFKSAAQKTGEMIRNMLIFGAVQDAAAQIDKDSSGNPIKRDPETIAEEVKMGIPGARQTVGLKGRKRRMKAFVN